MNLKFALTPDFVRNYVFNKMWRIAIVKQYFTVIEKKVQHYDWDLHQ